MLKAGANLAIDINIARLDGFTDEVTLAPRSLPKGVTAAAVKSEGKGKTAKAVKLILKAAKDAAPAQFELVLVGKSKSGEQAVAFAVPKTGLTTHRLWLTVTK